MRDTSIRSVSLSLKVCDPHMTAEQLEALITNRLTRAEWCVGVLECDAEAGPRPPTCSYCLGERAECASGVETCEARHGRSTRSTVCESYNHDKDCGCECHKNYAPSPNVFRAVVDLLEAAGLVATVEGGGAACAFVAVTAPSGKYFAIGDVNETWGMCEYESEDSFNGGGSPEYHDLGVVSESNDAEAIAAAIVKVVPHAD